MALLFIEKIKINKVEFESKVIAISKALKINPNWLMAIMNFESAGTFSPSVPNGVGSGGVGLIQFMKTTAIGLGTTVEALAKMSNVQQLDYVYKYYKPKAGQFKTGVDLYLYTFFPLAMGKGDDFIFHTSKLTAQKIAMQNTGLDLNKDRQITLGEYRKALKVLLARTMSESSMTEFFGSTAVVGGIVIFTIGALLRYLIK